MGPAYRALQDTVLFSTPGQLTRFCRGDFDNQTCLADVLRLRRRTPRPSARPAAAAAGRTISGRPDCDPSPTLDGSRAVWEQGGRAALGRRRVLGEDYVVRLASPATTTAAATVIANCSTPLWPPPATSGSRRAASGLLGHRRLRPDVEPCTDTADLIAGTHFTGLRGGRAHGARSAAGSAAARSLHARAEIPGAADGCEIIPFDLA